MFRTIGCPAGCRLREYQVMDDRSIFAVLLAMRVASWCYFYRSERVARNIWLVANNRVPPGRLGWRLVRALIPTSSICVLWISRVFLIGAVIFAWRAWQWTGAAGAVVFSAFWTFVWWMFYNTLDAFFPWPTHRTALARIDQILRSDGVAWLPPEVISGLLAAVDEVRTDLDRGKSFMEATFGRVVERDVVRLQSSAPKQGSPGREA